MHLRYFIGRGSLKAQGGISSWVPELDPKSLGDANAGERFLQVPSIGRDAEQGSPVLYGKKIATLLQLSTCMARYSHSVKRVDTFAIGTYISKPYARPLTPLLA